MIPNPDIPHEISSARVLIRFALRIVILAVFADLGTQEFFRTSEQLLILAACYCVFVGGIRREAPLSPVLTHYDEAAAYAVAAGLVRLIP
jgi:hypothetical protein